MRKVLGFLLASAVANATCVVVQKTTGLSASTEKVTIQQPSSPSKRIRGVTASISCSVACEVILTRDGNAATATSVTPQKASNEGAACTYLNAYRSSNSTGGTEVGRYSLAAATILTLNIGDVDLDKSAGANFSIGTSAITGDVFINIKVTD